MNKSSGHRFLLALLNPRGKPPTLLQAVCATSEPPVCSGHWVWGLGSGQVWAELPQDLPSGLSPSGHPRPGSDLCSGQISVHPGAGVAPRGDAGWVL